MSLLAVSLLILLSFGASAALTDTADQVNASIRETAPVLEFSTYLGGEDSDGAFASAVHENSIYVAGFSGSSAFTGDPFPDQTPNGELTSDAYIAKLSTDGQTVEYQKVLGGSGLDLVTDIAVTPSGRLVAVGVTYSSDFPVFNALQSENAGCEDTESACAAEAFVIILDEAGALEYATYLGGSGEDAATSVALGKDDRIVVAGATRSSTFPTRHAFQPALAGNRDAFVAVLDGSGSRLLASTYLGGANDDEANGVALSAEGDVFVAGFTSSRGFPLRRALDRELSGPSDAFVSKLGPGLGAVSYSTYVGGSKGEIAREVVVDDRERIYLAGVTDSGDFPTRRAIQPKYGGRTDAFALRISSSGSSLSYSTYLGGGGIDNLLGANINGSNRLLLSGTTRSTTFPTRRSVQPERSSAQCGTSTTTADCYDAFFSLINGRGSSLVMSTYFGGSGYDEGWGTPGNSESLFFVGFTGSLDFPTKDAVQPVSMGGADAFVAKVQL